MPELDCTVENCIYNKQQYCCKGDILVDGKQAVHPNETCCSSFQERRRDSESNSCGEACRCIDVDCKATQCVFNEDCKCSADHIGIAGANACACAETECSSFVCE